MTKLYTLALALMAATTAYAEVTVIYGQDNREDIYSSRNSAMHLKLAKSTAGMVDLRMLGDGASSTVQNIVEAMNMTELQNVCSTERFAAQPLAANCSGFLVGPDTLVTAGHCYLTDGDPKLECDSYAWIFDYQLNSEKEDPTKNIPKDNIYKCKSVEAAELNGFYDYAVIKLDRKVVGREPLQYRSAGKISDKTPLLVIGHPNGLPLKISNGGKILNNTGTTQFETSLDTFQGNSGSAVFDAATGLVEGILIEGKTDYVPSVRSNPDSCLVVNKCDDSGKGCSVKGSELTPESSGEVVMRISKVAQAIKKALLK